MGLWDALTDTITFATKTGRGMLRWAERAAPWPLSLVPRTMRIPLDVASIFLDVGPDSEAARRAHEEAARHAHDGAGGEPHVTRREPRETARARKPASSVARETPRARERDLTQTHPPQTQATQPPTPTATEHVTTIAGARSDGPDDAPQFDREVRARLAPLYVRDVGDGPAIVFLHAFPLNGRMWEPQLEGLSDRFRVIAPDFAGFGLSWTPDASFSLADQAAAVELSLDDLKVDEMVLVGLSMGGYVAFPLVARLGRRVRGLVLANTRSTADDDAAVTQRHRLAAEVEANGVEVAADELLPKLIGTSTFHDRPDLVDRVRTIILENKEAGVAGALRAMASRPDSTPMLSTISCPTLVIASEDDVVTTVEEARRMASRLRDARVTVLPRAGHLSNLEAPEEFNRAVADFVLGLAPSSRSGASATAHAAGPTPSAR